MKFEFANFSWWLWQFVSEINLLNHCPKQGWENIFCLGGGFKVKKEITPTCGNDPISLTFFQLGWNHQLYFIVSTWQLVILSKSSRWVSRSSLRGIARDNPRHQRWCSSDQVWINKFGWVSKSTFKVRIGVHFPQNSGYKRMSCWKWC